MRFRNCCLVIFLCLSCLCVFAQTPAEVLDRLAKAGVMDEAEIREAKQKLPQVSHRSPDYQALYALHLYEWSAAEKAQPAGTTLYPGVALLFHTAVSPAVQDSINETLQAFLNGLKQAGVVSPPIFSAVSKDIRASRFVHRLQLLQHAIDLAEVREQMNKDAITRLTDSLLAVGILSAPGHAALMAALAADTLTDPSQLMRAFAQHHTVDLAACSDSPAVYLNQLCKEVSGMVPSLAFTAFSCELHTDSLPLRYNGSVKHTATVRLIIGGKIYTQTGPVQPAGNPQPGYLRQKADPGFFCGLFNAALADQQSPWRLHECATALGDKTTDDQHFTLTALTQPQAIVLQYSGYFALSDEDFRPALTNARKDSLTATFQRLGLLDHLSSTQIDSVRHHLHLYSHRTPLDVLAAFPYTVYPLSLELPEGKTPYRTLLATFQQYSHGVFSPTNIRDTYARGQRHALISFRLGSKQYRLKATIEEGSVSEIFTEGVSAAMQQQQLPMQLCFTRNLEILFLTPAQRDALIREGIVLE